MCGKLRVTVANAAPLWVVVLFAVSAIFSRELGVDTQFALLPHVFGFALHAPRQCHSRIRALLAVGAREVGVGTRAHSTVAYRTAALRIKLAIVAHCALAHCLVVVVAIVRRHQAVAVVVHVKRIVVGLVIATAGAKKRHEAHKGKQVFHGGENITGPHPNAAVVWGQ